jgi:glutamate dehydrogenase/leucine dehydrogenase
VGAWAARLLSERGGIIRAVSDASGCILDSSAAGVDVTGLLRHIHAGGSLHQFPHGEPLLRDEIFDVKCDVMVPAALGGVIDGKLFFCTCFCHHAAICSVCTLCLVAQSLLLHFSFVDAR